MSIGVGLHVAGKAPAWGYSVGWSLFTVLRAFNAWFWMIAILSAGMRHLTLVIATVIATTVIYDLVVRRTRVTRFLFGMRPKTR